MDLHHLCVHTPPPTREEAGLDSVCNSLLMSEGDIGDVSHWESAVNYDGRGQVRLFTSVPIASPSLAKEGPKFYRQHKLQLQPRIPYLALNIKDLSQ